tara:strand:- start:830 stop:1318 length:489 start_codon:yes stop_codon:yes gene_type:complete
MNPAHAHDFVAVAALAYPADPEKVAILSALDGFAAGRPGLQYANYGDPVAYRAESRAITRDLHHVYTLLRRVQLAHSITSADLKTAFRAYSGRLTWDGSKLDYCTGQYFPTEYRRAVCAVLAAALWDYWRGCVPESVSNRAEWIRCTARRQLGRTVADRWFN